MVETELRLACAIELRPFDRPDERRVNVYVIREVEWNDYRYLTNDSTRRVATLETKEISSLWDVPEHRPPFVAIESAKNA